MENGTIADDQISASSVYIQINPTPESCCIASFARLNHNTRWRPSRYKTNHWIRIDLRQNRTVTGLITQGGGHWVKTLYVKYEHPVGTGELQYIMEEENAGETKVVC